MSADEAAVARVLDDVVLMEERHLLFHGSVDLGPGARLLHGDELRDRLPPVASALHARARMSAFAAPRSVGDGLAATVAELARCSTPSPRRWRAMPWPRSATRFACPGLAPSRRHHAQLRGRGRDR